MIIRFFHNGQTMLIDGVEFCKYRTLDPGEPVISRMDCKDFTDDQNKPIACPPVNQAEGPNLRLEFWYERNGNPGQLLCHRPVFLMSDEGKTIERI